ncbi:hypothetical protein Cgig2_024112 [Carnegiea gigantea]|uniref:DNA-directed RNA polymerase n=1 Tax=Carnegiea gigantea TaxID=171969 RepID=A0A9Q1JNQ1_9CARY|nr:hypothetical protein Cgig2_024112 [Carnegiea gigantea]
MGEDKSNKLHGNIARPVLGDITNQKLGKRGFSELSSRPKSPLKSGDPSERHAEVKTSFIDDAFRKQVTEAIDRLKYECCGVPNSPYFVSETPLSPLEGGIESATELSSTDGNEVFFKKVAFLVENLKRQRCDSAKCPKVAHEVDSSPLKSGKIVGCCLIQNTQSGSHGSIDEVKEPSGSATDSIDQDKEQNLPIVIDVDDITVQTRISSLAVGEKSEHCERNCLEAGKACQSGNVRALSDVLENDSIQHDLAAEDAKDDGKTICVDYLPYSRSESVVSSRLTESTQSFKLGKCTALNGDESYNSAAGLDLLKSCICSFCTKAAYIWSDLHYQDVKGRISLLMKSQKEASHLAQRYSCDNAMSKHGIQNSGESTHMEIDLMNQWKSLFLHMENVFVEESNQLQTNFLALKDLKDDFKMNLESMNGMPSFVQTCSSDASDHRII